MNSVVTTMPSTKEILKKVKKLEIKTKHLVDGLLQGAYHSIFKGRGIEFSEVRPYAVGDDIRTIDWNVTARLNEPFVKEFIEERDLTIYVVMDISGSVEFGKTKEKKESAIELAASLMFAALRNNDKVGLALFTDKVERFIAAKKGRRHILQLVREMIYYQPKSKVTDFNSSLRYVAQVLKKRSTIFIISDFFKAEKLIELRHLKNRHDVILININDESELQIPMIGYVQLEDEETGERFLVNTSDKAFQEKYRKNIGRHISDLTDYLKKSNIDMINMRNGEGFEIPLRKFFKIRMKRLAR